MNTLAERALRYDREHARGLRALAYRMLGSRAEAEDIVQEAWLRWADVDESTVQHAGAYLSRLVTNLCLDKLASAAARRERYVGVWLPEPLLDDEAGWAPGPEAQAEFAQDVSVAFMLALERLSPLERAAFLLHEVFDLDFDEIALRLQRSPAACRQLASRARNHVKAAYARREVLEEERERLFSAFTDAVRTLDVDALARALADDAVMLSDGGGKVHAVPRPLHGGALVARTFIGFARRATHRAWRMERARINGLPGCLMFDSATGELVQAIALAPAANAPGRIGALYIQRNPDKLRGLQAALGRVTPREAGSS
jgi:RNA polymerase sigma-70 factor (ECF subfamily)